MRINVDFRAQLSRQLGFLRRSCDLYDQGHHEEAIRIATGIRILVHQTKQSTSLLKHLNATTINLLSTTEEIPTGISFYTGMGRMRFGDGKKEYFPALGDSYSKTLIPVSKWWNQAVMVLNAKRITRKNIVLGAANQDGGAHVDSSLDTTYEQVTQPGAAGTIGFMREGKQQLEPLLNTHLVSLRQMGYEILNSPALLAYQGG